MPTTTKKRKSIVTTVVEEAEIECILDERGSGGSNKKKKKHEYLCAWADGKEEPQWVNAKYVKGTPALEEWHDLEECQAEILDSPDVLQQKCHLLATLCKTSKRVSFLLGAGISAPVLPTFRGKHGLWTKEGYKNDKASAKVSDGIIQPTLAHRGLVALEKAGYVYWVATQNYDDLSRRSGFPYSKLSELHGNIFTETCDDCHKLFHRNVEVPKDDAVRHETGRFCEDCSGILRDSIIHFEEDLPWHELKMANAKFVGSDLTIVLGSSLQVEPAASLPFRAKRRSRRCGTKKVACIVSLQPTGYDDEADLIIRGTCDQVIDAIAKELLGESWDTPATADA